MFKQLFSGVRDKYQQMKAGEEQYQSLLTKALVLPKFYSYTPVDKKNLTISYKLLTDLCPDLNEKDAVSILGLIPVDEVCFSCLYATECKTGVKFYFVATTKYLWLIHVNGYLKYQYQDLSCTLIKNGLMSKVLWIGNMLFTVNGLNDVLLPFIQLLQDSTYRDEVIRKQSEIFCGSVPQIFYLNEIGSGISIGKNYEIVFHTREFHYSYFISDIKNYELLLDDMVVREKKSNRRGRLTANKSSCYQMMLRVVAKDQILLIPILEKTTFMTLYSSTNELFRTSREFADKLVNLLDDVDEKRLNGEIEK